MPEATQLFGREAYLNQCPPLHPVLPALCHFWRENSSSETQADRGTCQQDWMGREVNSGGSRERRMVSWTWQCGDTLCGFRVAMG